MSQTNKNTIYFWKPHQPNGFLSQWYPSQIIENENTFTCAEQYMMYHKALLFQDKHMAQKILQTHDPAQMKALGRKIHNFQEPVWQQHRLQIVQQGNWLKFTQNQELYEKLIRFPEETRFAEASPYDRIWGIGFYAENAEINVSRWGLNLLGQCLENLRKQFAQNVKKKSQR